MIRLEGTWEGELEQRGKTNQFTIEITQKEGAISGAIQDKFGPAVFVGVFDADASVIKFEKEYMPGSNRRLLGVIFKYEGALNLSEKKISGKWFQATDLDNEGSFWIVPKAGSIQVLEPCEGAGKKHEVVCAFCSQRFSLDRAGYRNHGCPSPVARALITFSDSLGSMDEADREQASAAVKSLEKEPWSIHYLTKFADQLFDKELFDALYPAIDEIIKKYPASSVLIKYKAQVLGKAGEYDAAIDFLDRQIAANPANLLLKTEKVECLYARGDYNESIKTLEAVLAQDPGDIDALHSLGNILLAQGKYEKARATLLDALELAPGRADLLRDLSYAFVTPKDFAKSIRAGLASLENRPRQPELLNFITFRQFNCNLIDEAIASARRALALDPSNVTAKNNLDSLTKNTRTSTFFAEVRIPGAQGTTFTAKLKDGWQMEGSALSFWDYALEKGMTPRLKAKEMILKHDYLGAIPIYKDIVDKHPNNTEAWRGLTYALLNLERYEEVRELLKPASMRTKVINDDALVYYLCTALEALGEQRDAMNIVKESKGKIENIVVNEYLVGHLHMAIDPPEPQGAISHLEQFLDHDPTQIQAKYDLARAYAILGKEEKAFTILRDVVGHDPASRAQIIATKEFSTLVEKEPFKRLLHAPGYFLEEGKRCIKEEQYGAAWESLEHALKEDPASIEAHLLLGAVLAKHGLFGQAFPLLEKALDLKNDDAAAVSMYLDALARAAHPDKKKAKSVIDRFLEANTSSPSDHLIGTLNQIPKPETKALKDLALLINGHIKIIHDDHGDLPGSNEPSCVIRNDHVVSLDLTGTRLCYVPPSIKDLTWLETLVLDETRIRYLDDNIVQLPKLKSLSIRSAALSQVPDAMGQLVSLESLDLAMNELCWLPASIGSLKALRVLDVSSNMLMYLPRSLAGLQTLEHLVLGRNFYLLRLPTFLQNSSLIDRVDIRDTPLPGAGPAPAGTFTGKKWDAKASPRGIDWLVKVNEDVLLYVAPEEREFIQKVAKNTYLTENAEFFEEVVSDPKFLEIIDNMDVLFLVNDSHLVRFLCLIENPEAPLPACELRFLKSIIYCTYYRYKKSGLWMQSIKMDNLEELEFSGRHDRDVEPDHAVVNALLAHAPRLRALRIVDDGWNDTFFGCHDDLDMLRRALSNLTVEDVVVPLSLSFAPNLEEFCITSNRETENDKGFLPAGLLEHKKLRSLSISAPRIKLDLGKIVNLQQLESIKITSNSYKSIPEEVYALKNLKAFKLESRNLKEIPAKIGELNELRELRLIGSFAIIPVEIFNLKMLRCLEINSGQVNAIPKGLNQLDQLEELHIDCSIKDVPQSISTLRNLKVLILRSGDVKSFGNLFQDMKLLKKLELDFNRLEKLESNELVLPNLESLRLYLRNAQYRLLYLPRLKRLDTYVSLPRSIIWSESLEQLTLGDEHFPIEPIVI